MDESTAVFWLQAIAVGAVVVWLSGAIFVAAARRKVNTPLQGELAVPVAPAVVIAHVSRAIAAAVPGTAFQAGLIERAAETEVRWTSSFGGRHRGTLTVNGNSKGSLATWEVQSTMGLILGARIVVTLGAALVIALYYLLHEHVVTSGNPAIRAQVIQMVQSIHLLWPPFLLAGLALRSRTRMTRDIQRAVQNAQFG